MTDDVDKALAEIDLLAVADAVGVLRSGPRERFAYPPTEDERRTYRVKRRWQDFEQRCKTARTFDDPYPDPARPTAEQLRDLANELVADGWDPEYLAHRYGLTLRRPQ
jgi:hypothetical protein